MSTDTQNDSQSVLDELRATMTSLEIFGQPLESAAETQHLPDEIVDADRTRRDDPDVSHVTFVPNESASGKHAAGTARQSPSRIAGLPKPAPDVNEFQDITEPRIISGNSDLPFSKSINPPPRNNGVHRQTNKLARIMLVDDEKLNVMTCQQHLKQAGYSEFITSTQSTEALGLIRSECPDVLLLEINMPEVNGLDILRIMGLDPALQHIPVLVVTAARDPQIRKKALDLGANDFLSKPIDPNELLPRVRNAIILKQHFDMVANETTRLEQQVERRTRQLEATRQQLIFSLARAAEHRDNDTGNHVLRVGRYSAIIAEQLGYPQQHLSMLEQAAQLHDVGKIGIPDSILFKPGKLDTDEYELIKKHCALGKQIIEPISERDFALLKAHTRKGESLPHLRSSPLLMLAARIAQTHHEKWDGSGYPLGLSGEDIPLEGRIVAVADVFDALSSARPYKRPFSREHCFKILELGRGKHFDPGVLDAFFTRSEHIIDTQLLLMDEVHRVTGNEFIPSEPAPASE
ncbi:MAG: response regulator [Fuerstiella sp.]|nr:response regulator [Fuerstiella sp.]